MSRSGEYRRYTWFPSGIGLAVFATMLVWHWGRSMTLAAYLARRGLPMPEVFSLHRTASHFVEQTAILMIPAHNCAKRTRCAPALLQLLLERNKALPRNIVFVHIDHPRVPYVHDDRFETMLLEENANGRIMRVEMRFGFMELPDVEEGLQHLAETTDIGLEVDHRKWNVHVVREHLAPARDMVLGRAIRFRYFEFLRLISQPTYYHYRLGYDVPLSVEILPVHFP